MGHRSTESSHKAIRASVARSRAETLTAYAYLAPAAIVLGMFCIFPLFYVFALSFTEGWPAQVEFVGLAHYKQLVAGGSFTQSLGVTLWYALGTVPLTLVMAFLIANLLFQKLRGLGLYRTIYFLPYVTSTVAAAMVWSWIFHPDGKGLANQLMTMIGLPIQHWTNDPRGVFQLVAMHLGLELPRWLTGPSLALVSVMVFTIWHSLGFSTVIFLAGLTTVPRELYEAAAVDGANWWTRLWRITLPMVSPTAFFLLIISTIRSFQTFNEIYIMAPGQRLYSCRNVTMEIFANFWDNPNYGYAAAVAVVLFAIVLVLTLLQLRVVGRRVHY